MVKEIRMEILEEVVENVKEKVSPEEYNYLKDLVSVAKIFERYSNGLHRQLHAFLEMNEELNKRRGRKKRRKRQVRN